MKTLARILVLVVSLAVLGAVMWRALEGSVASPSAVEADREQRTIAYIADTDRGPRFVLPPDADGGTNVFRLLTFLHLPSRTDQLTYSPESRFDYGVRWIVREADGEEVVQGTIWSQTRKSKADFSGGAWRKESVYYSAGQDAGEPADGRLIDVDLTSFAGRGRTVEFLAADSQVNLVVFKQFDREEFRQQWVERTLSSRRKAELAGYARVRGWSALSGAERQAILDRGWTRQSSLVEVATRTLYETDFRLHESALIPVPGEQLSRRHHLVYNIEGPARLKVALRGNKAPDERLDGKVDGKQARVQATLLSTASAAEADLGYRTIASRVAFLPARLGAGDLQELANKAETVADIPPGQTASVRLLADVDEPLRAVAFIDRRQAVMGEAEVLEVGAQDALLRPDWKGFSQWEIRPGRGAAFTLAEQGRTVGQALRISLRGIADLSDRARLVYRFMAGDEVVSRGTIAPSAEISSFERLEPPQDRPRGRDGVPSRLLSEPTTHRFWLPEGATRLELDAQDGPVLVGVSALVFSEDARDSVNPPPYHQPPAGLSWRYAPSRFEPWQSFYPSNIDQLEAAGQRRRVRAQVRLRPNWNALTDADAVIAQVCGNGADKDAGDQASKCAFTQRFEPPEPPPEPVAVALSPRGKTLSRLVAESAELQPTSRWQVEQLSRQWDTSFRTRLEPDASVSCKIERGARIALDYHFSNFALLGATLQVLWDGEPVAKRLIRTQRDRIYVRPPGAGRTGRLEVQIQSPKATATSRMSLTADCSPASVTSAASVVRLRRVWRLDAGRKLRVRLATSAEEAPTLYVAAYAADRSPAFDQTFVLAASVDGGRPPLRQEGPVEQITAAERTLTFEPTPLRVELQSSPPSRLSGPRFAAVPTGTDWAPGWHDVELQGAKGQEVWVRFYTKVVDSALRLRLE